MRLAPLRSGQATPLQLGSGECESSSFSLFSASWHPRAVEGRASDRWRRQRPIAVNDVTTDDVTTDDVTTDDVTTDDVTTDEVTTAAQDASASSDESNGPAAPDFELTLGDGSTFRLSDEQKPVSLVFCAEW